ncbi:DinB family protein [Mucilaginibacter calamicampi]|uniref:DinB family protein n=1 Tax=Mucilaginibacter calamicampi TaxID=1302352 RepID=A0ABW2YU10_9SPHI
MKKLTLLFGLLALACTTAFAQISKEESIAEWTRAKAYTKAYLDAMPADGYTFKATPEVRSFAEQMLHLANASYYFLSTITGKPSGQKDLEKTVPQTKDATTKAVLDSYDYVIASIKAIPDADLSKPVTAEGMKTTKGLLLAKAFEHQTHHRGQVTVYLRLKGVKPPQEMLF